MKKLSLFLILLLNCNFFLAQDIPAYFESENIEGSMEVVTERAISALKTNGFEVIGQYNPEGSIQFKVIVFTRNDLQKICSQADDRGMLAAALKLGLKTKDDGKVSLSIVNPEYLFYAYLRDFAESNITDLKKISSDVISTIKSLNVGLSGFGGSLEIEDLIDYHYMAFMPYFSDPVTVGEFDSFETGYKTIKNNLDAKKGNTVKVYEIYKPKLKTVVFGVGLLDSEDGESFFLPIIGEKNIAAMPYEIILVNGEATILHGKFRFAISWPELSMSEFMKIVNTPGDVEDFMKGLCQ